MRWILGRSWMKTDITEYLSERIRRFENEVRENIEKFL